MRRLAHMLALLLPLLAACGDGLPIGITDYVSQDSFTSDLALLPDAVVIGEDDSRPDTGTSADPGMSDPGTQDQASSDPGMSDTALPPLDTLAASDAAQEDTAAGDILAPCGIGGEVCPPDTTCRVDGEGIGLCVPLAVCDGEGTIDVADMLAMLLLHDTLYVKVAAPVWVGDPSCSMYECPKDSPCCNVCFAQLFVGDTETPIVLLGQDTMFGCQGSECDVNEMCEPLEPGVRYRVWGQVRLSGKRAEFQVDGFCPMDDQESK